MRTIIVKTQAEWDALPEVFKESTAIHVYSPADAPIDIKPLAPKSIVIVFGSVNAVWAGGSVNAVRAGGSVNAVWGSVNEVWAGGSVNAVWAGGSVNAVWGSVNEVRAGGSVNEVWENGTAKIYSGGMCKKAAHNAVIISIGCKPKVSL